MSLIRFLIGDDRRERRRLLVLAILLGLSYALAGSVIGQAVAGLPREPEVPLLLAFMLLIALNLLVNGKAIFRMVARVEDGIADIRQNVLQRLRRLDYVAYEQIGHDPLYYNLATNVRRLSEATALLGRLLLNVVGTVGCLIMLAVLSVEALAVVLIAMAVVGVVYVANQVTIGEAQHRAALQEQRYFAGIEGLLRGFKELKLHRPKNQAFFTSEIEAVSQEAERARQSAGLRFFLNYVLFTLLLLLAAGAVLYVLPLLLPDLTDVAVRAAILAGIVPVSVLRDMPVIARAQHAFRELEALEARLQEAERSAKIREHSPQAEAADPGLAAQSLPQQPRSLSLEGVRYSYRDASGTTVFGLGPVSLTLRAGTVTFLIGGNGSGKSTLVKLLCGLYPPQAGRLLVDGVPIRTAALQSLITPLFADLHLFDRLYGYRGVGAEQVRDWLAEMGLADKTDYEAGRFTRLTLSTGQRKRLALIGALVEQRPILILDEWAAEQDSDHRAWYYREFLPNLKAQGRIVAVVSHDDRYFNCADQVIRFDNGQIQP